MSTIMPASELTRKALQWVLETRTEQKEKSLHSLIDEAGMRFNLSPTDTKHLERLLANEPAAQN